MRVVCCCAVLLSLSLPAIARDRNANRLVRVPAADTGAPLQPNQRATAGKQTPQRVTLAAASDFQLSAAPDLVRDGPVPRDLKAFDAMPQRPATLTSAADVAPDDADDDDAAPYRWDVRDHLDMDKVRHRRSALDAMLTLRVDSSGDATPGLRGGVAGGIWRALSR